MPISAVLFDFHGTLAQVEEPAEWVVKAAAACGVDLPTGEAARLAKALVAAGRAGGPFPGSVPDHLAGLWQGRDLSAAAHRECYTALASTVPCDIDGLPAALYDRLLRPEGWKVYADAVPVLRALRQAGVKVAMVSNIGFDLRPLSAALGLADLVDAYALSYEVSACKPEPGIFRAALDEVGVAPRDALMVGDTAADAGAASLGCRCLILPPSPPDAVHGLAAVLDLAGVVTRDLGRLLSPQR